MGSTLMNLSPPFGFRHNNEVTSTPRYDPSKPQSWKRLIYQRQDRCQGIRLGARITIGLPFSSDIAVCHN